MATRRLKQPEDIDELEVIDITGDGRGVAKSEGRVLFIDKAIPGDIADVTLFRRRKNLFEGKLKRLIKPSEHRSTPFCDHFGICGGCKWQHLDYSAQLFYKEKQVRDALERLAGVDAGEMAPILPSENTRYYRNKLEYTFSNRRWLLPEEVRDAGDGSITDALGFHIPGRFDKIVDIHNCYLQPTVSDRIRNALRAYALEKGLSFYDLRAHKGLLRNLIIRTAATGELMVILVFAEDQPETIEATMRHIGEAFPEITSLLYIVNQKLNDTIYDQEVHCWKGRDHIFEEMDASGKTLRFKIGPKSFYQTNSAQAQRLYQVVAEFAELDGTQNVYDLYTGAGTIANFIAAAAAKVVGIEYVEAAILDARENAALNGISNAEFFAGDMKEVLNAEFVRTAGRPEVIITDPPRAGMHPEVLRRMMEMAPERIVYVSCNPATQARDLLTLKEAYRVDRIQPVDMFPHTTHVENVLLLNRN